MWLLLLYFYRELVSHFRTLLQKKSYDHEAFFSPLLFNCKGISKNKQYINKYISEFKLRPEQKEELEELKK